MEDAFEVFIVFGLPVVTFITGYLVGYVQRSSYERKYRHGANDAWYE